MTNGIPIKGTAKGSAGEALTIAKRRGAQRLDFTRDYFVALYQDAATVGANADVAVSQWSTETGDGTSTYWTRDGNPAGLAAFDDGTNWGLTFTPQKAARAQITHLCRYAGIDVPPGWIATDARWDAAAKYAGTVTTTADLGNGKWATDPRYSQALFERYVAYWGEPETEESTMGFDIGNRPVRIAIGTGHANTSGGNAFELGINRLTVNEIVKLARRSDGFDIRCYTPNDGLGYFNGPLDAAAAQVRTWVAQGWQPDICIEVHQEGLRQTSVRGGHVIYPDSKGLVGRKATGSDTIDNDVKAAAGRMAEIITAEYGGTTRYKPSRGMSERETGVAEDGWRLGLFGTWSDEYFVTNACCLITEGATYTNPQDLALMKRPDFPQNEALGILKALIYLAKSRGKWTYRYAIGGVIEPADPQPQYVAAVPVPELARYVRQGQIVTAPPPVVTGADGTTYTYLGYSVRTVKPTRRQQSADPQGGDTGPVIGVGDEYAPGWLAENPGKGIRAFVSPWWSWTDPDNVEIVLEALAA